MDFIRKTFGEVGRFRLLRATTIDIQNPNQCSLAHASEKSFYDALRDLSLTDAVAVSYGFLPVNRTKSFGQFLLSFVGLSRADIEYYRLNRSWRRLIKHERMQLA